MKGSRFDMFDLAVERLTETRAYVLSGKELHSGRRKVQNQQGNAAPMKCLGWAGTRDRPQ